MRRQLLALTLSLGCAVALNSSASAQKTKVKVDDGKAVTYTGCVETGTTEQSYVLQRAIPMARSERTETSITPDGSTVSRTTTTTSYALVPESTVQLKEHVGHKVEVTGVVIPAGKGDTEYKAKIETDGSKQVTKGKVERGPLPQLRVLSVRPRTESCTP